MELLKSLFSLVLALLNPAILIPAIIAILVCIKRNKDYKKTAYYQITKYPFSSVRHNTGRYGEYLTYKCLKHLEESGAKFLFNIYIPKENGDTTEIDVLMICTKGIFVFESKNYSGWIFGSESRKDWYQTLPTGRGSSHKEHFYNPVMQNRSHIKHLRTFLGEQIPMHSVIVFSDRCTLKSVQIDSSDIRVTKRYFVSSVVSEIWNQTLNDPLSDNSIAEIYSKLYPFTQVDENTKAEHISNIHSNLSEKTVQQVQTIQPSDAVQKAETTEPVSTTPATVLTANSAAVNNAEVPVEITEPKPIARPQQPPKCPWCGGNLVLRTATRGANAGNQFYGCSNYPKCKYIKNIQ